MEQQLHPGQLVTVNAFGGKQPTVTVIEDRGDIVLVCKPEEYETSIVENRPPVTVGFHREDILKVVAKKAPASESREHRSSMAGD